MGEKVGPNPGTPEQKLAAWMRGRGQLNNINHGRIARGERPLSWRGSLEASLANADQKKQGEPDSQGKTTK